MGPISATNLSKDKNLFSCSACSLCLLPCPVWRQKRDVRYSWQGRAKAFQHGATVEEIAPSLLACTFCGSCDPVCPEGLDLRETMADMRKELGNHPAFKEIKRRMDEAGKIPRLNLSGAKRAFLPGESMSKDKERYSKTLDILNTVGKVAQAGDDGRDIALALEAGIDIPDKRLGDFLSPLKGLNEIIISDGILKRPLKKWLSGVKITSLGEALSGLAKISKKLQKTDLYIIESRAYNSDFDKMVSYYDKLRKKHGCSFNLDLNRIAMPTTASSLHKKLGLHGIDFKEQVEWLLEGHEVERIVAENLDDVEAIEEVTDIPVVHLCEI